LVFWSMGELSILLSRFTDLYDIHNTILLKCFKKEYSFRNQLKPL
jgi:hypothetical protein